ncbi:hypothetical protein UFOVP244_89 [uncultured Caudovirales phage]|uniref:Uncharacterized protein n=1 Tax=uncultured Caudovirales phage TaxID=2100421 RepID=A0A6J7WT59_9CAUD|nr:hypothetical protein UFOVP244_89 [uncultured Caudovirales phage]
MSSSYVKTQEESRRKRAKDYRDKLLQTSQKALAGILSAGEKDPFVAASLAISAAKQLLKDLDVPTGEAKKSL